MDATRFDRLAISLGAGTARRDALRFLAGLSFALLARGDATEAAAHNLLATCKKVKDQKKRKKCLKKARAHNARHAGQEPQRCETLEDCPDPAPSQLCAIKTCDKGQCGIGPRGAGIICRGSAGSCDQFEACDGISLECPADLLKPTSAQCSTVTWGCVAATTYQPPASCTGTNPTCPSPPPPVDCTPYRCDFAPGGFACRTSCGNDDQCAPGHYCSGSACLARKANGQTCSEARQCQSGHCVAGVCCNSACVAPANATRTCGSGTCAFACLEGFGDCDGSLSNGCETDTTSHKQHCGGCGQVCAGPCAPGLIRLCEDGACVCR